MIKAIEEHPGFLRISDASNESHLVAASVIKSVAGAGPNTSYLTYRGGKAPIFIREPIKTVRSEIGRAKILRRTCFTPEERQLELDFTEKETADQLPTESAAANTHQADEVRNAGS